MKETVDTDDRNLTDHPGEVMRSRLRNCFAAAAPIATAVLAEGRRCDSAHITPAPSASKLVLFVCTSNTCRSPMAEAIARRWFAERCGCGDEALRDGHGWDIRSAGLTDEYEKPGSPASANGITAMQRSGIDLSTHRSTLLSRADIQEAVRILCVSRRHAEWIINEVPEAANKTSTLGADIPDPWHQDQAAYDSTAETMLKVVPQACQFHFGHLFPT